MHLSEDEITDKVSFKWQTVKKKNMYINSQIVMFILAHLAAVFIKN